MTNDPATEQERAAYLDLKQRCQWLYGMGLRARLIMQNEDIRAWSKLGRRANIQPRPGRPFPGSSSDGGAAAEAEAPRSIPDRVREIIRATAQDWGVSPADIMGYQRTGRLVDARQDCYRRLRQMSWGDGHPSLVQVGLWLHRDHTTIHQGLKG